MADLVTWGERLRDFVNGRSRNLGGKKCLNGYGDSRPLKGWGLFTFSINHANLQIGPGFSHALRGTVGTRLARLSPSPRDHRLRCLRWGAPQAALLAHYGLSRVLPRPPPPPAAPPHPPRRSPPSACPGRPAAQSSATLPPRKCCPRLSRQ